MYYLAVAHVHGWGRPGDETCTLAQLCDSEFEADLCFTAWDNTNCTEEHGMRVLRGGVVGPYESLKDEELNEFASLADYFSGPMSYIAV